MKVRNAIIAVMLVLLPVFNAVNVMAGNNSSSLTVSPPNQEIILMPGETYEGAIVVSNSNDAENNLDYSVTIGSFSQKRSDDSTDDYGTVDTETVLDYNQMMEWITLGRESGTVAPNHSETVPFTIVVPEDAPAGGQYATLLVQDDSRAGEANGNVTIESKIRIAAIIYAEVAGETREKGLIVSNDIPSFLLTNKLEAGSTVRNDGNVHTRAEYTLQVWPLFSGEEVCTNEENPETSLIMPETERYHAQTCNLPAIGIFRAKQTVKIFGEISIVEKMIIVCPLWLLFIIIFAIVAPIIWLVTKSKARKQQTETE